MNHALRRSAAPIVHGVSSPMPVPALPATTTYARVPTPVRSRTMNILYEELARAHSQRLLDEAARERRVARHVRALRAQRRAERATLRARRLVALAVLR